MFSMKAASSINNKDTASERAASELDDLAVILEPFLSLIDSLFFSKQGSCNHFGRFSYMKIVLVTRFLAVA